MRRGRTSYLTITINDKRHTPSAWINCLKKSMLYKHKYVRVQARRAESTSRTTHVLEKLPHWYIMHRERHRIITIERWFWYKVLYTASGRWYTYGIWFDVTRILVKKQLLKKVYAYGHRIGWGFFWFRQRPELCRDQSSFNTSTNTMWKKGRWHQAQNLVTATRGTSCIISGSNLLWFMRSKIRSCSLRFPTC
jgi:hypothetical protein